MNAKDQQIVALQASEAAPQVYDYAKFTYCLSQYMQLCIEVYRYNFLLWSSGQSIKICLTSTGHLWNGNLSDCKYQPFNPAPAFANYQCVLHSSRLRSDSTSIPVIVILAIVLL